MMKSDSMTTRKYLKMVGKKDMSVEINDPQGKLIFRIYMIGNTAYLHKGRIAYEKSETKFEWTEDTHPELVVGKDVEKVFRYHEKL